MKTVIVIGNGMVGYKFCEKFVAQKEYRNFKLLVFGDEPRPAYDRVHLSEFFENQNAKALEMASEDWYTKNGIELMINERVADINRDNKTITTANNRNFSYDYLVLATGSSAFVPPIKGVEKEGVFVYRTIEDLESMLAYAAKLKSTKPKAKAAVLGGGLLGLEAGKAVMDMGLEPHIVEFAPKLMPRQLDSRSSQVLQLKLESIGLHIHLSKATNQILGDKFITGMEFGEDDILDVDMLIISAGIRPRDELGKACGLEIGVRGGIVVNNKMQTSDEYIYAIGEIALYNQMIYGLVAPGYEMASVAVDQIIGNANNIMSESIDMSTKLKLIGVDVASFGNPFMPATKGHSVIFENKTQHLYKRINVSLDGKKLLGGILVGDATDYSMLHQIYLNGMPIPSDPSQLILPAGDGAASFGSVIDLPDAAVVCSCEAVTKAEVCCAVKDNGKETVKDIAKTTKATTGCGGCKPMVTDLINETLKSLGKVVKERICEHFDYSRQELYDIVKMKNIKDYDELLDTHGKGNGCEVCKPLAASLFASIYNETANRQDTIQDSNDRYLANIQRNGTYSVVPRVAGGEISPKQMIAMGRIAQKYDLYTKITGGQRINMFGAKLHELPLIWEELIAEGFETGQAYGKSLRTVKSCVGSTWCRYGMDESVSFAIEIENRYKGIRSPHKFKGGVSGCIRECAEARGKDFGFIAVEGGWNIYICGNGGATPKHAVLLAEKVDKETAIKYVDRFLMYYIQTAQPLMRTAAWLEKLEGGIDYVKDVVINDCLGIVDQLDKDMQHLVETYKCEWKEAIETPEIRAKYTHFVNSTEEDENIEFVALRDQKMPTPWV
ncbi:nitrite reductase large subunit NirB [Cellulophaga lytica]|uniref:Nitrite reductase (NAD(P)H), large subunit n=1 Tax=Cellulophaga lytica (strain ATCC 23178 / DSM 7489 / JCM 8516 / NBRC 14961 / NCIMB 1423 / VKM B-1433 / Cy l20) TaxID=867900 RepID=F0RBV6_CELLC|nr:nitrite reductase large subunit NirB [Cellulophaga lytica]ADY28572.1 nitrite reductase (NAD(P)H), large subunit [Cellulophaga lytica DSM 7489]WQG77250.1 nitrite reductase large subunit NirB [Cellulophaga lytica]